MGVLVVDVRGSVVEFFSLSSDETFVFFFTIFFLR